jgi:hypothetical protein
MSAYYVGIIVMQTQSISQSIGHSSENAKN